MPGWRLRYDVDSCDDRLDRHLTARGWGCVRSNREGLEELPDRDLLALLTSECRVIYTCNRDDYARLHDEWAHAGRSHAGIIICVPQRASAETQLAALLRLFEKYGPDISNQLLWARAR